jgi:recombination associated protein RdgC
LRFLELIQDQTADIESENAAEQFDADFSIMSMELANFLSRLVELFGGENKG